jgi:hypothetical protein
MPLVGRGKGDAVQRGLAGAIGQVAHGVVARERDDATGIAVVGRSCETSTELADQQCTGRRVPPTRDRAPRARLPSEDFSQPSQEAPTAPDHRLKSLQEPPLILLKVEPPVTSGSPCALMLSWPVSPLANLHHAGSNQRPLRKLPTRPGHAGTGTAGWVTHRQMDLGDRTQAGERRFREGHSAERTRTESPASAGGSVGMERSDSPLPGGLAR